MRLARMVNSSSLKTSKKWVSARHSFRMSDFHLLEDTLPRSVTMTS